MRFCSYEVKDWILLFFCNTDSITQVPRPPPCCSNGPIIHEPTEKASPPSNTQHSGQQWLPFSRGCGIIHSCKTKRQS